MPKLVHSSQFIVHSIKKSVNRQLTTACPDKGRDNRKSAGFTLIELLIVIVIIGVLATIGIYVSMGRVAQARDAVRKSDLDKVKKALELAKSECKNGEYYPFSLNLVWDNSDVKYNNATDGLATYLMDPDLTYLKKSPYDPKNDTTYYYGYTVNLVAIGQSLANSCPGLDGTPGGVWGSKDYRLTATLENKNDPDIAKSQTKCPWDSNFVGLTQYPSPAPYTYVVCPN